MDKLPKTGFRQSHFLRMICEQGVNTSDLIKIHNIKNNYFSSNCAVYSIQHCFICRPSDFTVSEDAAGIEPRTVATSALTGFFVLLALK